jgi:hypothetical protein
VVILVLRYFLFFAIQKFYHTPTGCPRRLSALSALRQ